jgi:H-NS histone family
MAMTEWEYKKIDLNQLARQTDEIDVLCKAGEDGWELVVILANNVAYLKRELDEVVSETTAASTGAPLRDAPTNGAAGTAGNAHEVKAKYRDPATGDTWSGRGRMAGWLKKKQDAGEDIEKYRV